MTKATTMTPHHGVLTLTGYGLRLAVERGHLVVDDGIADRRRRARFSRVDRGLKRVVIIGHSGMVTLDAIAWLQGVGVPLIHLDHDARVYFVSSPAARTTAPLRRAQALAGDAELGFAISRDLVLAKLEGQLGVLERISNSDSAQDQLTDVRERTRKAPHLNAVKDLEAKGARAYWRAWRQIPVQWVARDAKRRPRHWRSFGSRASPLTDPSPRKAVNPANAVLNYCYAMLEAEATIAALAARLDPTLGFLHADRAERASLACDLMEPVRPLVDTFVLSLFRERSFTKADVFERRDGHCRLLPPLTHQLAATAALWAPHVWPVTNAVAKALGAKPKSRKTIVPGVAMPPIGARRPPRGRTAVARGFDELLVPSWATVRAPAPRWTGYRRQQEVFAANRAWDKKHGKADPKVYRREILPKLAKVSIRELQAVTGLSKTTCSQIKRGRKVPHPRHWEGLRGVARTAI
jgi:CRISPR-associated endonuclease Cas1